MLTIFYAYFVVLLAGMGLVFLAYLLYRKWSRGRIICYIYNKNRTFYKKSVKPNDSEILRIGDRAYIYREHAVQYTKGFLLQEPVPCLIFEEAVPTPVTLKIGSAKINGRKNGSKAMEPTDLHAITPSMGEAGISSKELSDIMQDKTVRDFVSAQSKTSLTQVMYTQLLGVGIIVLAVGAGIYYLAGLLTGGGGE